jgi:AcrR family transcriptional regulator
MRPRQFSDEALMEVARRCFLEHGPNVSTKTIAAQLGVSPPALFRRVGSKGELMRRALAIPNPPAWVLRLEAGPTDAPVHDQLLSLGRDISAFFVKMMPAIATLRAAGISPTDVFRDVEVPPPIRAARAFAAWFQTLADQGRIEVADPEATGVAFLGALQSRHMAQHLLGNMYPDGGPHFVERTCDVFARGIAPRAGRKRKGKR